MSAFDEKTGLVNIYELLPRPGDMIVISHCGTHYEIRHQHLASAPPLVLTDAEIEKWRQGLIVWN